MALPPVNRRPPSLDKETPNAQKPKTKIKKETRAEAKVKAKANQRRSLDQTAPPRDFLKRAMATVCARGHAAIQQAQALVPSGRGVQTGVCLRQQQQSVMRQGPATRVQGASQTAARKPVEQRSAPHDAASAHFIRQQESEAAKEDRPLHAGVFDSLIEHFNTLSLESAASADTQETLGELWKAAEQLGGQYIGKYDEAVDTVKQLRSLHTQSKDGAPAAAPSVDSPVAPAAADQADAMKLEEFEGNLFLAELAPRHYRENREDSRGVIRRLQTAVGSFEKLGYEQQAAKRTDLEAAIVNSVDALRKDFSQAIAIVEGEFRGPIESLQGSNDPRRTPVAFLHRLATGPDQSVE